MTAQPGPAPRFLAALATAVLAAHLALLLAWRQVPPAEEPSRLKAFITRTIAVGSADPVRAAPAPSMEPARPRRPTAPVDDAPASPTPPPMPAAPPTESEPARAEPPPAPPPQPAPVAPGASPKAGLFVVPGSVRLHYQVEASVRGLPLRAEGELLWRHDGSDYEAKLEVRGTFFPTRTQRSAGQITADGVAPQRFSDRARSEEAAHFDRDRGLVTFSSNRPQAPLLPGAQDRLSVMLQLASMIAGEPARYPAGTAIRIQTASTRDAEPWVFTVEGEEQLQLPGGTVAGLKLTRLPRREFDQKVELWLAPAMDYVPVRVRLTNPNGDSVDQLWSSTDRG